MNTWLSLPLIASLISFGACAADPDPEPEPILPETPLTGDQFVVDRILLGSTRDAQDYGFDYDGEGPKNSLGQNIALVYSFFERESQAALDDGLANGEMLHLIVLGEEQEPVDGIQSYDAARVFLGADTDADPSNNFDGNAQLGIRANSSNDGILYGERTADGVDYFLPAGSIVLENTLFAPMTLPLKNARLRATFEADGSIIGSVGGLVSEDDLETQLIPTIVSQVLDDVAADCQEPGSTPAECCTPDSRGLDWVMVLGDEDSCSLSEADVTNSSIIHALFAPDVDSDGDEIDDSQSVGFGFTAVPAQFEIPR